MVLIPEFKNNKKILKPRQVISNPTVSTLFNINKGLIYDTL